MKIPSYKVVRILSENKLDVEAQLKAVEYGQAPYAFDLDLLEKPQPAIDCIENYLETEEIAMTPYPIIVISKRALICEILDVYPSIAQAPRFFNQKTKAPNIREQAILSRLELKRKSFESLRTLAYEPILKKYSISHKIISELAREAFFYEQLLIKLKEDNHGK